MGRAPCCEKIGLKKGPWTPEEDQMLIDFIKEHGHGSWRALPKKAGLLRCGKSCRLRWTNYLRPDIKRGKFCLTEEQTIIQLHALLGNRWSTIASHLPKRTDNEIKNYWNTHLKKRLVKMGIDPETHKPKTETPTCLLETSITGNSSLSHMAQWESARLEAEARLARESKLRAKGVWQSYPEAVSPNDSSTVSPWNAQASDPSSKPDLDVFGTAACKALSAVDLMDSLQNWDESLQGQARLMWPETWNSMTAANGRDSSCCCSSPHTDRLDQGSPTSTLSSLEINLQQATQPASSPALQIRRLSWTDILAVKERTAVALKSDSFSSLGSVNFSEHPNDPHVGDIFQNACAGMNGGLNVESLSSSKSFQDLVFTEETAILSPSRTSSPWSHDSSDDDFSMDVQKRDSEGIPALASATTSSSLLGDLELVSEDISSNKSSFSSVDCGVISGEFLGDFSRQHHDLACGTARQDSFSALVTEETPDYWTSMLKQLVDSPM